MTHILVPIEVALQWVQSIQSQEYDLNQQIWAKDHITHAINTSQISLDDKDAELKAWEQCHIHRRIDPKMDGNDAVWWKQGYHQALKDLK